MSGLRFCMLTTFYPPHNFGGDGIAIQRLARALVRRGHEVTVIHDVDAFNALRTGPEPAPAEEPAGLRVERLRSGLGLLSPLLTQQLGRPVVNGRRIAALVEAGGYDVTMFHNVSLVGGPGLFRLGAGVKLFEAHEHWLVCPMHVLWRHNREVCAGRECVRCSLAYRRPPQLWRHTGLLERRLEGVDAFVAKSEFSRQKHREFGFPRPMTVIPYFLPDAAPAAEDEGPPEPERPYFLFVGRLEKIKGLDDVIPAMRAYGEADLLIAGDGEYGALLRQRAAGIGNVRFLGRVSGPRLRRLYRDAIALLVPSVCWETFGIILIEAFQQGTPVIARRIGPFPEIIAAGGGGLLFEDTAGLLAAMRSLQAEAGMREVMSVQARASFACHWSERAVVPRYLELVHEVAERNGNRGLANRIAQGAA
jgi:glycosyltransferase involved in cell wall biosynthesis